MKNIDVAYLSKKINKLNKKINRAKKQGNENKVWWRKIKFDKLTNRLKSSTFDKKTNPQVYFIPLIQQFLNLISRLDSQFLNLDYEKSQIPKRR